MRIVKFLTMQLKQALASAIDRLEAADVGSPRMNAEVLLMFVLGANRAYLYAHPERELTPTNKLAMTACWLNAPPACHRSTSPDIRSSGGSIL